VGIIDSIGNLPSQWNKILSLEVATSGRMTYHWKSTGIFAFGVSFHLLKFWRDLTWHTYSRMLTKISWCRHHLIG